MMKKLRYALEALLLLFFFTLFRLMPAPWASNVGGWIGRVIGPRLAASRKALRNIEAALPDIDHKTAIRAMWDNLGRVMAEYPHLEHIGRVRAILEQDDIVKDLIASGKPAIFIGAHQGNWEVNGPLLLTQYGRIVNITVREPNNKWSAKLLDRARTLRGRLQTTPKSRAAGRALIKTLKNGGYIGMLTDQKYNPGLEVPFFGRPAMTNPAAFELAQKYDAQIIPIQNIRTGPARFKLIAHPPIDLFDENGAPRPLEKLLEETHILFEEWITAKPGQWLWLHRRWK